MSNEVYANNREIACKAASGKTICAFPDVCFTPPLTPATPPGVPIPYPNTGMASDCAEGSASVKISGQEIMLKNKSHYKKSSGDEAGNAPKKSVITSKITGKCYFNAWSMDVKVEGENVVRHLDLTTHNHASQVGATPPFPNTDAMVLPAADPVCQTMAQDVAAEQSNHLPASLQPSNPNSKPSTVAVGYIFAPSGAVIISPGHSGVGPGRVDAARKNLRGKKYADYARAKKTSETSNVRPCSSGQNSGTPFTYAANNQPYEGHAEAKIIEDWFKPVANGGLGGVGTLVLSVTRDVCPECARLIRAVNCSPGGPPHCNRIKVCSDNQGPTALAALQC